MTLVREFHEATGQLACDYPMPPDVETIRHRLRLINEEHKEVVEQLQKLLLQTHLPRVQLDDVLTTMRDLLKEMCDLRYVLDGTAVSLGLPIDDAYVAVHESNMTKRFPDGTFHTNASGKVLKGPDYKPPDMTRFVEPIIDMEPA